MNILIIINDAPYGNEKAYNAMRMAMTLQKVCWLETSFGNGARPAPYVDSF